MKGSGELSDTHVTHFQPHHHWPWPGRRESDRGKTTDQHGSHINPHYSSNGSTSTSYTSCPFAQQSKLFLHSMQVLIRMFPNWDSSELWVDWRFCLGESTFGKYSLISMVQSNLITFLNEDTSEPIPPVKGNKWNQVKSPWLTARKEATNQWTNSHLSAHPYLNGRRM